ncbi:ribosome assembly factor SBDS [Candidatus Micrarchaeota archaeon]|nr:MAG: ribosome assembly factor SBDS [Candidatus Micrarchaeota archaeon]
MISVDKAVIARYEHKGKNFEVLVEPERAQEVRKGNKVPLDELVADMEVFSDVNKGERAKREDIIEAFGTDDFETILYYILRHGNIQITTEQRRKMQEAKRKKIINMIAKNAVDPNTHMPHPMQRIENAMKEANIHIDPFKSPEEQLDAVISALRRILPLKIETDVIEIIIPATYAARVYGTLKKYKMTKERWLDDGSLYALFELPTAVESEFLDFVNKITAGNVETKIIERK